MKTPSVPHLLARRFEPLIEAERTVRGYKLLATVCAVATAALALYWLGLLPVPALSGSSKVLVPLAAYAGLILIVAGGWWWISRRPVDLLDLARGIEEEHPELQAALLTALEKPDGAALSRYLHEKVVKDAVRHGIAHDWMGKRRRRQVAWWKSLGMVSVLAVVALQTLMLLPRLRPAPVVAKATPEAQVALLPAQLEVEVRPGDAEVERGTRLVVEARFKGGVPENATIVVSADAVGEQELQRVPMKAGVEASAFGGVITKVDKDSFYRVAYGTQSSPVFRITTYVHPELVQSDAIITPPAYSGQPVKEVKKTQNVTALEGSQVKFRIKVNKPVAQAELYGEDKQSVPLVPAKDDPLMLEGTMTPEATQKYRLHLVDAQERSNKQPPWFKVNILADQPPKVEIVFPKRDLAVSPIQEMPLEAKVWDDLGVRRAGAVFMLGDQEREVLLSGDKLEGRKHHELKTMMEMESLKAEPRQLLSYYVWAEDAAPGGQVRRTQSDMFFAEVRHFEDIFREGEAPPGGEGGEGGGGSPATKLGKLQKEVLNATWKVVRTAGAGKKFDQLEKDMGVLHESQEIARQQTEEAIGEAEDEEVKAALTDAHKAMQEAVKTLHQGIEKKDLQANTTALTPERRALEALNRAQSREHRVMRNQQQQSSSASSQSEERQLMQLELKQEEKRYEEEKAAGEEKTVEQQENLQVLARLKELARRQEALAEKIKEVENQLQQAKTEEQKQELEQQLKRLQEEQEQLLKDLDDLKERMDRPENQANMAQEREQLDQAREQVREAADQLAQQQTGSAASAATKAQENLEKVRDEFRERTARRFAEEMKQLKQDTANLAGQQEKLAEQIAEQAAPQDQKNGKGRESKDQVDELKERLQANQVSRQAEAQRESLEKLMEQMRQLSEQAEPSEPLLSTALHDAMRKAHSAGIEDALGEARDQVQYGRPADAQVQERKAAKGIEDLKQSVDKAAESVLGSETESLRMARAELDKLLEEASRDANRGGPPSPKEGQAQGDAKQAPGNNAQTAQAGKAGTGEQADDKEGDGKAPGGEQGKGESPSQDPAKEARTARAQPGEKGQQPGSSQQPGEQPGQGQGQGQEKSDQPGQGQGQGQQMAANEPAQGQGKGQGQTPGQQPGQSPGQGQGQSQEQGQGEGQGQQGQSPGQGQMAGAQGGQGQGQPSPQGGQQSSSNPGQGQGQGQGQRAGQPGQVADGSPRGGNRRGGGASSGGGGESSAGDSGGGAEGGWFFDQPEEQANDSAITGANYEGWADRLRRVEEALSSQELREQAARVQDNARNLRVDSRRNDLPPQSDQVRMQIVQPLAELRDRVMEALARKESANPLAPLDRDPVPHRYREQVRRYYTELGGGN